MNVWTNLLSALAITSALSIDALVASFAYGASKIKIPLKSSLTISLISTTILAIAIIFGKIIAPYMPQNLTKYLSFAVILIIGITKLFGGIIKNCIKKHLTKEISFKAFDAKFILKIIGDSTEADVNKNKVLSPAEAASLAFAVSLDGLAVGFSAGVATSMPYFLIMFSFLTDMLAIIIGSKLGNKIAYKTSLNLSWLSGLILIIIAVIKLF